MLYRNLMLTMIIGGLWHGAAWTFVLWGFYQGVLLVGHRLARALARPGPPDRPVDRACWKVLRIVVTFHLVCFGWLIFRAGRSRRSWACCGRSSIARRSRPRVPPARAVLVLPLLAFQFVQYVSKDLDVLARTPWYVAQARSTRPASTRSSSRASSAADSSSTSSSEVADRRSPRSAAFGILTSRFSIASKHGG